MKTCPVCGFHNTDVETRCARCSGLLPGSDADPADRPPEIGARSRLRSLLSILDGPLRFRGRLVQRLLRVGAFIRVDLPEDAPDRNPWKAGFLGLIPGLAQLYNHQPKKAFYFVLGWCVLATLVAVTFYHPVSNVFLSLAFLWMAYSFHDGLKTAILINRSYWNMRRSLAAFFAWIFYIGAFFIIGQYALSTCLIRFRYISTEVFEPHISKGDKVAINVLAYRLGHPRVGDIVYYDPKSISIEVGSNVYVVDPTDGIERVVAGPNQTFERRDGGYLLDGLEVPADQGPLVTSKVTWDYAVTAPEDHYVIIHSYTSREYLPGIGPGTAPRMDRATAVRRWNEACVIPEREIMGRVFYIYQPPPHRRYFPRANVD